MYTGSSNHRNRLICIGIAVLMIHQSQLIVSAQRPSFAGSRPAGGLSQKDKYNAVPGTAVATTDANGDVGIANRFGQAQPEPVTLAYGAVQRPPMGVSIVTPIAQYVPINNSRPTALERRQPQEAQVPQFTVDNRIGESDTNSNAGAQQSNNNNSRVNTATIQRPAAPLPLDARGDQALIDHLNRLPIEQQPFWFVNYQAIEAQRNSTRPSAGGVQTRGSFFG